MSLNVYLEKFHLPRGIYSHNITHNLNRMADAAGIYYHLWQPETLYIKTAGQLIEPLEQGLARLLAYPFKYRRFNPANGWGKYEDLVNFVQEYLAACKSDPNALVRASG